jgi:hypothetical protein
VGAHLRQAPLHTGDLEAEVYSDLGLEPAGCDRARDAQRSMSSWACWRVANAVHAEADPIRVDVEED